MQVLSLSEVDPEELEEVFQQEIQCWSNQLFWDYRPAVELIVKYMRSRSLPGHVLKNGKQVAGYAYHLVDPPVGYIGNIYVRCEFARKEAYEGLLRQTLRALKSWSRVQRIECQVFPFNFELCPIFQPHGFLPLKRHFLALSMKHFKGRTEPDELPAGFRIVPWERKFFIPTAEVIHNSYCDSPDYGLCRDYQSREGCIRFLRNLVDNPGCGTFTAATSYVVLDEIGSVCAILVTSKIGADTGMIPQISVRSDCQGKKIGTRLLNTYFEEAKKRGLKRITLSVSEANQRACQLYLRMGFEKIKDFNAYIWTET